MQTLRVPTIALSCLWLSVVHPTAMASSPTCSTDELIKAEFVWYWGTTSTGCETHITSSDEVTKSSQFSWDCKAINCTKFMEEDLSDMPDCLLAGQTQSERAKLDAKVTACKNGASTSSGSSSTTTTTPTTTPSKTPTPTSAVYSDSTCSNATGLDITALFKAAAQSDECKDYGMVSVYMVSIFAPCTSLCVTQRYEALVEDVPDCFLDWVAEKVNKKQDLMKALAACSGKSSDTSVYILLDSPDAIESKSTTPYDMTPQAGAPRVVSMFTRWVAIVTASVASVVLML